MAVSQQSYDVRIAKYQNGDGLIQSWVDYTPTNPLITAAANTTFIADVVSKNGGVVSTYQTLSDSRDQRRPLMFFDKKIANVKCLESRIKNIEKYVSGDLPDEKAAIAKLKSLIRKIQPKYKKKVAGEPRGAGKSPSEQSFNALVGYGKEAIGIITALGAPYAPTNPNITLAQITMFVTQLDTLNITVAKNEELYGNAVRLRKDVYDGVNGLSDRVTMIKNYLAGFEGGKNSPHYIEFSQAVK